jgi:hypothetical protein
VNAGLDARQQVPPQVVKAPAATGTVSGTLVVAGSRGTLTWRLTVHGLTGPVRALELRRGRLGQRGQLLERLCGPCRSHGSARVGAPAVAAIRGGAAYVTVTTRRNPRGEIRGQLRLLGGA